MRGRCELLQSVLPQAAAMHLPIAADLAQILATLDRAAGRPAGSES